MKKYLILISLVVFCLPLLACSGQQPADPNIQDAPAETLEIEQDPADATQPPVDDEDHVHEAGTTVTSLDQIVGTWIAAADLGNFVATIDAEGTFRVATSLEDLEQGSTDSWKLTFDEQGAISATGFAMCLGDTGSYLAIVHEDGSLKFTSVLDPCEPRLRKMDRSLPGRLNPYNLIYYRVEFSD